MNIQRLLLAAVLAGCAWQGAKAQSSDADPFFYDPAFNGNGIYEDGIAGANGACLEQQCDGVRLARLSNGDIVTAVRLYSFQSDGVGGGGQSDGDFALVRYNAAGQRVAWAAPGAFYGWYNNQYVLWPNNDVSAGRMVSRLVDIKVVDGYIYVLFEYSDSNDSSTSATRTGLSVFSESGEWKQTSYRLLCQIGECSDTAVGIAVLPGVNQAKRLLVVGSTFIYGNLADRGIKVKGMVLDAATGYAWSDANFGDADSRTFFQVPDSLCRPEMRPCQFSLSRLTTATDNGSYGDTSTYLVGSVKWNNSSSDPSGYDNNVLVVELREDGHPALNFGVGMSGFQSVAFNADGRWNDLGMAIAAEKETLQSGDVAGGVYIAANVGDGSIGLARLDPESGAVDTTFGNGGLSIKGGHHCETSPCMILNDPAASVYSLVKDGDRLIVGGSNAYTSIIIGGGTERVWLPLFAVARASDGHFTEFQTHSVPNGDAQFNDLLALGDGRYATTGTVDYFKWSLTTRLRADRIFGNGFER